MNDRTPNQIWPASLPVAGRKIALAKMQTASDAFYSAAVRIGVHSYIEFTGVMNEYIKACRCAHENGIDFTQCNAHIDGAELPMEDYMIKYINEKLTCIFGNRVRLQRARAKSTT